MSTGLAARPTAKILEEEVFDGPFPDEVPALERVEGGSAAESEHAAIRDSFEELADELEESTAGLGSTRRAISDPAFVEILALGDSVIPQVVNRLTTSHNRPLWLRLLGTLTSSPPGAGQATIDEAADAWIRWQQGRPAF